MDMEKIKEDAVRIKEQLSKKIVDIDTIDNMIANILTDNTDTNADTDAKQVTNEQFYICKKNVNEDTYIHTKNDLISLFKLFLKTKCNSDNKLVFKWETSDGLFQDDLEKILKTANEYNTPTFKDAANEFVLDDYINLSMKLTDSLIAEFYQALNLKKSDIENIPLFEECLLEDCIDEYHLTTDIKQLLNLTPIKDLSLYFKTDDDIVSKFINKFDYYDFDLDKSYTAIDWLLKTQGYTRKDFQEKPSRDKSIFLTSLYTELFTHHKDLTGFTLTAVPNTTDFEAVLNLSRSKNVVIKKSTKFGLFNSNTDEVCGMNIILEKDIFVDKNTPTPVIRMIYNHPKLEYTYDTEYYSPLTALPNLRKIRNEDLELLTKKDKE